MTAEGFRDCERGDKHRRGCGKHHRQHDPVIRVDCVRQPGIARPRPPQNRHNEQPATEPTPRRIIHQQGRHLRKREHEHEVEEELGRRHPVVQLGVKLGHNPTLTRTRWRRETTRWIHLSHEYTLVLSLRSSSVCHATVGTAPLNGQGFIAVISWRHRVAR